MISEVYRKGRDAKEASYVLQTAGTDVKNKALAHIAEALVTHCGDILSANAEDVKRAEEKGMAPAMVDRLTLTEERISAMAEGVRQVIDLPDPVGVVLDEFRRPNGLFIQKVSVPLGVIAIIFESRPNVTVDAAALCIKSGNACVLRGGSEAIASNTALTAVIREGLKAAGLPENSVNILENTDRAWSKSSLPCAASSIWPFPAAAPASSAWSSIRPPSPASKREAASATSTSIRTPTFPWPSKSSKTPRYRGRRRATLWKPSWSTATWPRNF